MSDFGYDKEIIASAKYKYPSHGYEKEPIDVEEDNEQLQEHVREDSGTLPALIVKTCPHLKLREASHRQVSTRVSRRQTRCSKSLWKNSKQLKGTTR